MILPNTPKEEERRGGLLGFFDKAVTPSEKKWFKPSYRAGCWFGRSYFA